MDVTDLGNELIPAVDNITTFQTELLTITDNRFLPDSSRVLSTEDHALGRISADPIFGKTTADIYFDVRPKVLGFRPFPSADSIATVDSVVLSLSFKSLYGDSTSVERFQIYEIEPQERANFKDSARGYLVNRSEFAHNPLLKTHDQDFTKLNDEYKIIEGADTVSIKNQMRIRLDNSFASRFINYDTTVYKTDSSFKSKFAGFAILTDSTFGSPNALAYFNLADNNNTRVTFYYKVQKNGKPENSITVFDFQNDANANLIRRNPAGSEYSNNLNNANANDAKLYLQTSPGSFATIKIPGLDTLSNAIIHRAELIVEKLMLSDENKFPPPSILFLDAIDSSNNRFITIPNDFIYNTAQGFYNIEQIGGLLNKNTNYNFNITRYVQGIVTRNEPVYTLRLYAPFRTNPTQVFPGGAGSITPLPPEALSGLGVNIPISKGRVVVAGGGTMPASKALRLRIIYSKI